MTKMSRRRSAVAAAASLAIAGLISPATAFALAPADSPSAQPDPAAAGESLIISEYIEGSSYNKALEIYNAGATTVDLSGYQIQGYQNGALTVGYTVALEGFLASGETYVVAENRWTLDFAPDQLGDLQFNGDDAVVLSTTAGSVVDSLGQVGVDPGTAWGTPPTTTVNATLIRNAVVCVGDTIIDDAFDPATQFSGMPQDDISNLGAHTSTCGGPAEPLAPVINEFSASTAGDDAEFLEVYGEPETDYSSLTILQVEGDSGSSNLGKVASHDAVGTTDAAGFWAADLAMGRLQNGTLTLLLVEGYTDQSVLDADLDGVIDEGTGLTVLDSVAVSQGNAGDLMYSETVLAASFDGGAFPPGGASRIPDGTDADTTADWVRNDFNKAGLVDGITPTPGQAWNTPGETNRIYEEEPPPPGGECGDPAILIGAVQGPGAVSPVKGDLVSVEGTVVADFQDGSFAGFYVQDAGDDNAATSDGIFVHTPAGPDMTDVAEGDEVRVTGTVDEFFTLTQVKNATISVCATGTELPEPTELVFPLAPTDLESVESMHVTFPDTLSILEYYSYGRFGEVVIGTGLDTPRQFQPTAVAAPDSDDAIALRDWNASHRITLDDHSNDQNPAYLRHPAGGQFGLDHLFRGGDTLTDVTGVIDYRFGAWKVQPTQNAVFGAVNPRPTTTPDVGASTMTVASFNVLNYFTTLGERGAVTSQEFDRQESKIVSALAALDADVFGLIEIENNDDVAVQTLTDALNAEVGAGTYEYIATGMVGDDAITTAFIFKPAEVNPVGDFATLTSADNPLFLDAYNRPTLAQTFEENATGETVTVAVNHLKSKGSSCDTAGDPTDPWAGNCNGVRTDAAEAMVDWLANDPTNTGSENTLVIGDLNSYDKEDPINVFLDGGYADLLLDHQGEYEYSYVFDGQLGYLDYALANDALASRITGTEVWKINADEPSVLDYTMEFKPDAQDALFEDNPYRSSDHDPVLVGLALAGVPEPVLVDRIAGANRYATSAAIAAEFGDVDTVYLASGQEFPDALTGTAPAVRDGAPVLLTRPGKLSTTAATALGTLQPEHVYVLGGTVAISDAVLAQTEELTGADVVRISGSDRYGTASELAMARYTAADVDTVYIADGQAFADSLAGGPLAGIEDDPILLTRSGKLPQATVDALVALDPEHVVVLGGEARISDEVLTELKVHTDSVERLAGKDRYETAALIADRIPSSEMVFVASGQAFPDALSGAAWAGHVESPLLLTRAATLPNATAAALVERDPSQVTLFGGSAAIAEAVRTAIEELFLP